MSTDLTRCVLCGECVDACLHDAREIVGRHVTTREVMAEIEQDLIFYDESGGGVTFSGGEPLMQPDFLRGLLHLCKKAGIHTAVDTSCFAPWKRIQESAEDVDLYLIDLKHMDSSTHERVTGVPNEPILENLRRLVESGKEVIVRIPVIPGFNDDADSVDAAGRFVASLPEVLRIDLLPYNAAAPGKRTRLVGHPDGEPVDVEAPTCEQLESIAGRLASFGLEVLIGG